MQRGVKMSLKFFLKGIGTVIGVTILSTLWALSVYWPVLIFDEQGFDGAYFMCLVWIVVFGYKIIIEEDREE